ncbi:hypothetical protein PS2_018300 [Malus domestica]
MPSSTLDHKSPFQLLHNTLPEIHHLKVFGCSCYPWLRPYTSTKLEPRTTKCVFLSYASKYKGFLCSDVSSKKVYVSRHVTFDETDFPYKSLVLKYQSVSSAPLPSLIPSPIPIPDQNSVLVLPPTQNLSTFGQSLDSPEHSSSDTTLSHLSNTDMHQVSPELQSISEAATSSHSAESVSNQFIGAAVTQPLPLTLHVVPEFRPEHLQVVLSILPMNLHPMQTRSKSGISKKIALLAAIHEH